MYICKFRLSNSLKYKKELYNKIKVVLNELLDISSLIKKLDEFKKLKNLILNEDQVILFNFLSKDHINSKTEKIRYTKQQRIEYNNQKKEKMYSAIEKYLIIERELVKANPIDKKLKELIEEEMKLKV